jgi:SAM-dependent methyltransferase
MSDLRLASAGEFFEAIARRYDRDYARHASRDDLKKLVQRLPPRARVLDLGVGTGRELTALLDGGHEVVGLDVSPTMLEICARRARPISTVCADLWQPLPFADAEFDVVLALHGTLAHPPSEGHVRALSRELARVLRAGGIVMLEVPSEGWLTALAGSPASGAFRATRTGADRCVHEDRTAGLAIEATVLSSERWTALLREHFTVSFETLSDTERLITGWLPGS